MIPGDPEEPLEKTVDLNDYQPGYEFLKDAANVPEDVKKIFRLKMCRRAFIADHKEEMYVRMVQRHPHDNDSHEAKIARHTARVRTLVEVIKYVSPNDARSKVTINWSALKRNKLLKELYEMDRSRYEVMKRKLNISHTPTEPGVKDNVRRNRKTAIRVLSAEYSENLKKQKMVDYHQELKSQQKDFLQEKQKTIDEINEIMKKFSISEEDVSTEVKIRPKTRPPTQPIPLPEVDIANN